MHWNHIKLFKLSKFQFVLLFISKVSVDFVNAKGDAREHNLKYAKKIAQFIEQNKVGTIILVISTLLS